MRHTASRLCQHIAPCLISMLHIPSQAVSVYCSLSYKYATPPAKPIALPIQWLGVAWISHAVAVQPLWVFHHGSRVLLSTQQPRTSSEVIKRHLHEAPIHSPPVAYEKAGCRICWPPMLCHPSPPHIHAVFHRNGKLVTVIVRMIMNAVNIMPHLIRVSLFDTIQWWHMLTDWNATAFDGHCWTADTSDKETAMSVALSDSYQSQHESTKNIKSAFVRWCL